MKKFFTPLSLLFFCLLFFSNTNAQIRSVRITINFQDLQGNAYAISDPVIVRNTDSVGHPTLPFYNRNIYQNQSYYYDSCGWDTSYMDSLITINYYACGQWNKLDTFFNTYPHWQGGLFGQLHLNLKVPCYTPCNAAFNRIMAQNELRVYFSSKYINGWTDDWDFGDGQTSSNPSPNVLYADSGEYVIRHIVSNSVAGCSDTAWDTVHVEYVCNAHFVVYPQGSGNFGFSYTSKKYPGYTHLWDMGDGNVYSDSDGYFFHQYNNPDSFTVRHIVNMPGYCTDTFTYTLYNAHFNCNFSATVTKTGYTVTVTPSNTSVPFFYTMGDGNSYTRTGTFQHTYMHNGANEVRMQDVAKNCSPKSYPVNISVSCTTGFTATEESAFTIKFYNPATTSGDSWYFFGDGDSAQGDTVVHSFPAVSDYYYIRHRIIDGSGNTICMSGRWINFNSCGNSDLNGWVYDGLAGAVRFDDTIRNDYDSLIVYLILYDSVNATLTAVDSTVIYNDSGYFLFSPVCYPAGTRFLVKAALLPGSSIYSDFLPTYRDSSVMWSGALPALRGNWNPINMRRGNNPGGPGFIGGYISQGANKSGAALDGIQVTVLRSDGVAVAYVLSANAGRYEFSNLAYGDYRVLVEIPGKPSEEYTVTLDAGNPSFDNLDFEVNSTDITTTMVSVRNVTNTDNLKLYPNPADNSLFVEWAGDNAELVIVDMNGKACLVKEIAGNGNREEIDVDSLVPGLYYVRINDGVQLRYVRIAIQ